MLVHQNYKVIYSIHNFVISSDQSLSNTLSYSDNISYSNIFDYTDNIPNIDLFNDMTKGTYKGGFYILLSGNHQYIIPLTF